MQEQATLVKSLFHGGDPETSREAAQKLVESGELSRQESIVYAAILDCPDDDFTARELADKSDLAYFMIQRRLSGITRIERIEIGARLSRVTGLFEPVYKKRDGCAIWRLKP